MKEITYQPAARKALRKMPIKIARKIVGKIEQFAADPDSLANNVVRMKASNAIRLRVGDWRGIMEDGAILDVWRVGPRGGIYKDF